MSKINLRLGLLAGAALALTVAGVGVAQTAAPAPKATTHTETRVVTMTSGEAPMVMSSVGGDVEQTVTEGPNGERRVMIIRHGGGDDDMDGPEGKMGGHHRMMDPAAHAQHLRDILQLRADQEPALQAFLAAAKPPEKPPEHMDPEAIAKMTTPERLDWMSARMAEHQARFQQHADAIKKFYAALNPAQRKAFEAAHVGGGGDMMFGGERHEHHEDGEHGGRHHGGPPMPPMPPAPPAPPGA